MCVCTASSREALCVCVLHSLERHYVCMCSTWSREALCVCILHSLERHCVCVLHSLERHCVCTAHSREALECLSRLCSLHTRTQCLASLCSTHMHHGQICCPNTDYTHINRHDRTMTVIFSKHSIELPDDGYLVIRNMLEQF